MQRDIFGLVREDFIRGLGAPSVPSTVESARFLLLVNIRLERVDSSNSISFRLARHSEKSRK